MRFLASSITCKERDQAVEREEWKGRLTKSAHLNNTGFQACSKYDQSCLVGCLNLITHFTCLEGRTLNLIKLLSVTQTIPKTYKMPQYQTLKTFVLAHFIYLRHIRCSKGSHDSGPPYSFCRWLKLGAAILRQVRSQTRVCVYVCVCVSVFG